MHVDDYIDTEGGDPYARVILDLFRLPADVQVATKHILLEHKLFCTYDGKRYRVTGASRMGDVLLHTDLTRQPGAGYDTRLHVERCEQWGPTPVGVKRGSDT